MKTTTCLLLLSGVLGQFPFLFPPAPFQGALGKEGGGLSGGGEGAVSFFLPEEGAVPADLEDAAAPFDEGDGLSAGFLDFSRHPVGFGAVVSLDAVFDLDGHAGRLGEGGGESRGEILFGLSFG